MSFELYDRSQTNCKQKEITRRTSQTTIKIIIYDDLSDNIHILMSKLSEIWIFLESN